MSEKEHDDDVVRFAEGAGARAIRGGQLPWAALAGLGLACFAAGVLLVKSTLSPSTAVTRPDDAATAAPSPPSKTPPPPQSDPARAETGPRPRASAPAVSPAQASPPVAQPQPPEPPPATPQTEIAPRNASVASRVVPGRVAYLRCEGLERARANPPCPRDGDYELAVLREIDSLKGCSALPSPPFTGDLRVEIRGAERTVYSRSVSSAEGPTGGNGNRDAWVECIREGVTAVVPTLSSPRLVVSFRFDVLPR